MMIEKKWAHPWPHRHIHRERERARERVKERKRSKRESLERIFSVHEYRLKYYEREHIRIWYSGMLFV